MGKSARAEDHKPRAVCCWEDEKSIRRETGTFEGFRSKNQFQSRPRQPSQIDELVKKPKKKLSPPEISITDVEKKPPRDPSKKRKIASKSDERKKKSTSRPRKKPE